MYRFFHLKLGQNNVTVISLPSLYYRILDLKRTHRLTDTLITYFQDFMLF